jgi:hypothetical protein
MAKWTRTPAEYEHARKIILECPLGQTAFVTLKNGATIKGWIAGANTGTDVGDNLSAGRGPIVTSMYAEVKLQLENGQTLLIDAVDIQASGPAPRTQNSN